MCANTKQRIADAAEELLCSQPGGKITVQQVMELTQMNRQSFYYHYQDIGQVLQRIVERKFCNPLAYQEGESVELWCRRGLTLLKENKTLVRRISRELGSEKMYTLVLPVIRPQVERLLPPDAGRESGKRQLAVDAICHSLLCSVTGLVFQSGSLDVERTMERLKAVLAVLREG